METDKNGFDFGEQDYNEFSFGTSEEGLSYDRPVDTLALTGEDGTLADVKSSLSRSIDFDIYNIIQNKDETKPVEDVVLDLESKSSLNQEIAQYPTGNIELMARDYGDSPSILSDLDRQYQAKLNIWKEVLGKAEKETDFENRPVSFWGRLTDRGFLDRVFLRGALDTVESLTGRTSRLGATFNYNLSNSSVSVEDFRKFAEDYVRSTLEEGVLTTAPQFSLEQLKQETSTFGFDPLDIEKKFLAVAFSVLPSIGPAARTAARVFPKAAALKAATPVARATAVAGEEAGAKVGINLTETVNDVEAAAKIGPSAVDIPLPDSRPAVGKFAQYVQENEVARQLNELYSAGYAGRTFTPDEINAISSDVVLKWQAKNTQSPFHDVEIVSKHSDLDRVVLTLDDGTEIRAGQALSEFGETTGKGLPETELGKAITKSEQAVRISDKGLGVYTAIVRIGNPKKGGEAFAPLKSGKPPAAIKRLVENTPGAKIALKDANNPLSGYVVELEIPIDTTKLVKDYDVQDVLGSVSIRDTFLRLLGNTAERDAALLDATSVMAEQSSNLFQKKIFEETGKVLKSLPSESRSTMTAIYTRLRDGEDSFQRIRYSRERFEELWKEYHPKDVAPTEKDWQAYSKLEYANEAAYLIKASENFRHYVRQGYNTAIRATDTEYGTPAKIVRQSDVIEDATIFDASSGVYLKKADLLEDAYVKAPIYRLSEEIGDYQYVIKPLEVRVLDPVDTLHFNPGGPRLNPREKFFITIRLKSGRLKALMGARTEKQARLATKQIETIEAALKSGAKNIDDIIKNNSDFALGIQNVADYLAFKTKHGWYSLEGEFIAPKPRNHSPLPNEVFNYELNGGRTLGEVIENDYRRGDISLPTFGGEAAYNTSPVNAIYGQLNTAAKELAFRQYTEDAILGWLRHAPKEWLPKNVDEADFFRTFKKVDRDALNNATSSYERRMAELYDIIERKLNIKSGLQKRLTKFLEGIEDTVINTSDGALRKIGSTYLKQKAKRVPSFKIPAQGQLLHLGFFTKLSLSPDQLIMQGFNVIPMLIAHPVLGTKAATFVALSKPVLRNVDDAVDKLWITNTSKRLAMTEDEVSDLLAYMRKSGTTEIAGSALEIGTEVSGGLRKFRGRGYDYKTTTAAAEKASDYLGKGLEYGRLPFTLGDKLARYNAMVLAAMDFQKKNPGLSILNNKEAIVARETALNHHMRTIQRYEIQSGLLKVPTQFLSFLFNSMQSVFVGTNLTIRERLAFFAVYGPALGLTGLGVGESADWIAEQMNEQFGEGTIEADRPSFRLIKDGVFDALIQWIGQDAFNLDYRDLPALSKRLSVVQGLGDYWKSVTEGKFAEVIGGPSGGIAYDIIKDFAEISIAAYDDRPVELTDKFVKTLSNIKGVDNFRKAHIIANVGRQTSRATGRMVPGELSVTAAIVALTGFSNRLAQDFYAEREFFIADAQEIKAYRSHFEEQARNIDVLMRSTSEEDNKRGKELALEQLNVVNALSVPPEDRADFRRVLLLPVANDSIVIKMLKRAMEQGNNYRARRIAEEFGPR